MDYFQALERAYKEIKPIEKTSRFEIPEAKGFTEGNKTIITNFSQIADYLKREIKHLAKYLAKELAVSFVIEGQRLILNRKIKIEKINEKINDYVRDYVICRQCGKPDTHLIKQDKIQFLHCWACGARYPVPKI
ncbi:MAG: translation initiation factor IF-2 subunit beta [Candidatus Pacearchaeota archaeon]